MFVNHLEIFPDQRGQNSEPFYLVKNTASGRYVRLGGAETRYLLQKLHTAQTLPGLEQAQTLAEPQQKLLDEKFDQWGFLQPAEGQEEKKPLDLTKIKLVECNVERVIHHVYPFYSKFFTRKSLILFFLLLLACVGIVVYSVAQALSGTVAEEPAITIQFSWVDIAITAVLLLFSLAAHELAHAVVCKKYGGEVKSMGLLLFFLVPCFYCDVTDVYKIPSPKQRARVALAGVYVNSFLGVSFLLLAFVLTLFGRVVLPFYYFALSNLVVSVYNLIPLVKLDGYWFLSAVLQVNNLMDKGFLMAYATFFHRSTLPELRMPAGQRRLLAGYGVASLLFKPMFWGYNLYAISTHLPAEDWVKWGLLCVGAAIMVSDFYRTLRHASGMIRQDYRRLTQMM